MKLFFSRAEADADDIALLYRAVGYTTVDEGYEIRTLAGLPPTHFPSLLISVRRVRCQLRRSVGCQII
jgi:hypothetical protein